MACYKTTWFASIVKLVNNALQLLDLPKGEDQLANNKQAQTLIQTAASLDTAPLPDTSRSLSMDK